MASDIVGSRELKARLGKYLRCVRQGRTLVVTDRGEPIAELRPIRADAGAALARLKGIGAVTRVADTPLEGFRQIRSRGASGAAAVIDDRDDRF